MENTKSFKIDQDIRQSDGWCSFLKKIGWEQELLQGDIKVNFRSLVKLGSLAKVQRPRKLLKSDLVELEKIAAKKNTLFILIEPGIDQDIHDLHKMGYAFSSQYLSPTKTVLIDLAKSNETLWKDMHESARYSINRAIREKVTIECYRNPTTKKLKEFYPIHELTAKLQKFKKISLEDLMFLRDTFIDDSYLILAYDEQGALLNGRVFFGNKNCVWYMFGGTSDLGRGKNKAGYLLQWESFKYFKSEGYSYLDLEGVYDSRLKDVRKDWSGLSYYKEKFGGTAVDLPLPMVKYISPVFKVINKLSFGRFAL